MRQRQYLLWTTGNCDGVSNLALISQAESGRDEMPTQTIEGCSDYPFNDTHFTVGNRVRQIDNFAAFHNTPGDRDRGGANAVMVDGHVELLRRMEDLDEGFRLCWPKKELPF